MRSQAKEILTPGGSVPHVTGNVLPVPADTAARMDRAETAGAAPRHS